MEEDLEAVISGQDTEVEAPAEVEESTGETAEAGETVEAEETAEASEAEEAKPVESPSAEALMQELNGLKQELGRVREQKRKAVAEAEKAKMPEDPWSDDYSQKMAQYMSQVQTENQRAITTMRLDMYETMARKEHDDFDVNVDRFVTMVKANPVLYQQMQQAPNPAEFAYKIGRDAIKMDQIGSLDELIAKERAEERARVTAELQAETEARIQQKLETDASLPGSLAKTRATGGNSSPPVTHESLEDLLPN